MTLWLVVPIIFIIFALIVCVIIVVRKIPQLRVIDISSNPVVQQKQVKDQILMQRLERTQKAKLEAVSKILKNNGTRISKIGRRAVQKLHAWEQYYEKLKKSPVKDDNRLDPTTINTLLMEAEKLVDQEEFIPAEKKYIEVISHHPRHIKAYQGLVDLYMKDKQYEQAKETLLFVLRLDPENAQVHAQMSHLELLLGRNGQAFEQSQRALELAPKHPKIIDSFIECAFLIKDLKEAQRGIKLMEKFNPENQKLADWKEKISLWK